MNTILRGVDVKNENQAWIGVDLDGTLAIYNEWRGVHHIGAPIWPIVDRMKTLINTGITFKIFTARVCDPKRNYLVIPPIRNFLVSCGLPEDLEITNAKDFNCIEIWDNRAKQVGFNRGNFLEEDYYYRPGI